MRAVTPRSLAWLLNGALTASLTPVWPRETTKSVVGDNGAAESDTDLAKQIQNPVGDLISFPLQYSVNFGYGPHGGTQHVLNLQPVIPFHLNDGWYLSSGPNITANWQASGTKWTVPIGGGGARVFRIGALPADLSVSAYNNLVKPTFGGRWQLSTQLTFVF